MSLPAAPWDRAVLALSLFCVDPAGLQGLSLRARAGPVRDRFCDLLPDVALPMARLHPATSDEALFGGLDLGRSLAERKIVLAKGLAHRSSCFVLAMAERCGADLAARLAQLLDARAGHGLVALDEGADPDERAPPALTERLAFHIDLNDVAVHEATDGPRPDLTRARDRLPLVCMNEDAQAAMVAAAAQLGIDSLRAPLLALRVARANAALAGRDAVHEDDLEIAAQLVLAPRALRWPDPPEADDAPDTTPEPTAEDQPHDQDDTAGGDADAADDERVQDPQGLPQDVLIDAVRAVLPDDVLQAGPRKSSTRGAKGSGAGARRTGNRRGRPLPSRPGRLGGSARIDLVATLRSAAPWQALRRAYATPGQRLVILPSDIRLKRFEDRSDRVLVFAVDASGSAALARLAEAKGAVELLLAQAYARRDHVALVAFRGDAADILLPPTRSLVQTKRRLAALPGGGGTPLAAGLRAAGTLSDGARRHGFSPTIALLTDGRANIALDGRADRTVAGQDAEAMARWVRALGVETLTLDVGNRPSAALQRLSDVMGGRYLALPRADAHRMKDAIGTALGG